MSTNKVYTATEARARFADVFDEAHYGGPVVVSKGRKKVAVIPYEMLRRLEDFEAQADISRAKEARKNDDAAKDTPLDELEHGFDPG